MPLLRPSTYPAKLRWSATYTGWPRTLLVVLLKPLDVLSRLVSDSSWYFRLVNRQFDRRWGVETSQVVELEDLDMPGERQVEANEYNVVRVLEFGLAMDWLDRDWTSHTFVDIGAGKGRAILLAAAFPFRHATGIELAANLIPTAEDNLARYPGPRRAGGMSIELADALTWRWPSGPLLLFLYNPFGAELLTKVLEALRLSLEAEPRPVVVLYCNGEDEHRAALAACDVLQPIGQIMGGYYMAFEHVPRT